MLALFHLEPARRRPPGSLSGGEKKRLALAAVLAMRPALLILDEPMGGLDPIGRQEVLAALSALRRQSSTAIVMTESDPEAVAAFADRLLVLHQGQIALQGPPRQLFRQAEALGRLGVAVPQLAHVATDLNEQLATDLDFLSVDEGQAALAPLLSPPTADSRPDIGEAPGSAPAGTSPALRFSDLWFWYQAEDRPALRGVDLEIPRGQFVALVGANGSGKTTLVKHANGLLRPRRGRIDILGQDAAHRPIGALARQVGFLFQHPEQQIFSPTVRREVAFGPRNLGLPPEQIAARVEAALARFDLTAVAETPPAILGYGLRRRVTLASLAAMDPPILVLDEPTVGLDALGCRETVEWLAGLHAQGRTIVLVSHDMATVAEYAQRVVVLHQGQVLADGPPAAVFQQREQLIRASLSLPPVLALAQALQIDAAPTVTAFTEAYLARVGAQ
jgi:energy-coupling factor transport system ATP-binding protein